MFLRAMLPLFLPLLVIGAAPENGECERRVLQQGCTVDEGHAHCEAWDLAASLQSLPACTAKITFLLLVNPSFIGKHYTIDRDSFNFTHIRNLEELTIYTNRGNFSRIQLNLEDSVDLNGLGNLRVLRLHMLQRRFHKVSDVNAAIYGNLQYLEVLDLTRAKTIGLSTVHYAIREKPSMKTLILKNVQELGRYRTYTATVDLVKFLCGGNVQNLDLSYNDITYITFSSFQCQLKLKYLNLDGNIVSAVTSPVHASLTVVGFLSSIERITISSTGLGAKYQDGLWNERDEIGGDNSNELQERNDKRLSSLSKLLQQTPVSFLAAYDDWFEDFMEHCGHFSYFDIGRCTAEGHVGICEFINCLNPELGLDSCPKGDITKQLEYFSTICTYQSCLYNVRLPLPPYLTSLAMRDFGRYTHFNVDHPVQNVTTQCFHPNNNLEYLDLSHTDLGFLQSVPGEHHISGLRKLKYVNLQGCQLLLHRFHLLAPDMLSLRELHIGGNTLAADDTLPADFLHIYTNLTVLNLSNADLLGIEADAFLNHRSLTVLDLSRNRLNASSLSAIDLSNTNIKSLNLSQNKLTYLPASLRDQLVHLQGLELYLSGNTFICSCENLEFLQWIQNTPSITFHYAGDHVCTDVPGNTIHNIEVDSLHCDWYWKQPIILVGSTLACILLIALSVTAYKKRFHISNLVFRIQERFRRKSDDSSNTNYTFDAFVIYSGVDEDRLWVHYVLTKELEDHYGFRLCLEHRNFPGGVDFVDNLEKAIRTSRKVILVMSKNFLETGWCVTGAQLTSNVDPRKFVVVMYKNVLFSGVDIPPVVKQILQETNGIEWNEKPEEAEKLFWKNLRRELYNKHQVHNNEAHSHDRIVLLNQI